MDELVHIHILLNLRNIRESKMNWVPFYQILFGSLYVAGKLPTYPSPKIVSVKKKNCERYTLFPWSKDWVPIGKSASWAKLMRNLFCENEFDLLGIEKKNLFH